MAERSDPRADGATVADVGEHGLVRRTAARLAASATPSHVLLGPGDDAAVLARPEGALVATTDLLVEGRHFRRDWSGGTDVGRKAAAQNLADVVAMGARPTALLVGLGVPAGTPLPWCDDLTDGLAQEAALVGAAVVGGDVVGEDHVVVAVTALGVALAEPVTRAGARPGDVVLVVGRLGWAAAGLAVLLTGDADLVARHAAVVDAHRRPQPPYDAALRLAGAGATSLVDVSDGLLADLGHVATASDVRVLLHGRALPVDAPVAAAAVDLGLDPLALVATGGDDHAFALTVPHADVCGEELSAHVVGEVRPREEGGAGQGAGVEWSGRPLGLAGGRAGWDHFGR